MAYYYSYIQSGTPGGTAAYLASTGNYRVFKTGAHILAIHSNFQGEINGIKVTDYPFGVVHENIITGCPYIYPPSGQTADQDNDGVVDCVDNCPTVPNPDQGPCFDDADGDSIADDEDLDFLDTHLKDQGFFCPF
ncbi:MAG: thrombospondin type 3 repeat-containing protein [Proteobacteria bacterium]|nr:thrombospondin type 3 repeat-containing protein [Pseudomonadota bacterium]MBU1389811.1 thrombospondin type 3 repeat-containing protein [Pseudomonadota bacterium]MBU1543820.1 thrombospondin type 3 repeat-containing protein [Pseudomonadota bacterium]MBU2430698.1 thrombospondin type 3 repeat-containing protein [Pseudomonadota bacterium]MBU2483038.1 thrombospondin type 3 repeat-containing protein [Pseudomonadota bacterium]